MANQPYSSSVIAGTDATASDHNAARKDGLTRYIKFEIIGAGVVANKQGGSFNMPFNGTVINTNVRTTSGSAVVRINRDATVVDSGIAATSTPSDHVPGGSPNFTKGQLMTLDITGVTSMVDLVATVELLITT